MSTAILSNRIYFKPKDNDELKNIINKLTYRIESKSGQKGKFKNIEIISYFRYGKCSIIN
jgi:hypothetical protein